jgi:hypothetical protein
MALRREWIPQNILAAARRAGLSMPDWYVGRRNGHEAHERRVTLARIVETIQGDKQAAAKDEDSATDDED